MVLLVAVASILATGDIVRNVRKKSTEDPVFLDIKRKVYLRLSLVNNILSRSVISGISEKEIPTGIKAIKANLISGKGKHYLSNNILVSMIWVGRNQASETREVRQTNLACMRHCILDLPSPVEKWGELLWRFCLCQSILIQLELLCR
jgi:hypothetical protein